MYNVASRWMLVTKRQHFLENHKENENKNNQDHFDRIVLANIIFYNCEY
jgi:predicted RNase H-like nuclease